MRNRPIYDLNDRLISTGVFRKFESLFERAIGWIPILGNFVNHHEPLIKRDFMFSNIFVKKPGVWSLRNLLDSLNFRWFNYRKQSFRHDDEAIDLVNDFKADQYNIAFVSAVFLTVWASFCTTIIENFVINSLNVLTLTLFVIATVINIYSTILPLFLSMAVSSTRSPLDATYFLELLDRSTFDLGSRCGIIFMYLSAIVSTIGIILMSFIYTNYRSTVYFLIAVVLTFSICTQLYLQIVSCLYCTMKSADRVAYDTRPIALTFGDLKTHLEGFLTAHSAFSADDLSVNCTADYFVKYVEVNSSPTPIQLNHLTSKRARRLFTTLIEKNMFEKIFPPSMNITCKEDLVKPTD